ncbi:hypothetical protein AOQ72_16225 [Bradyrhizobium yuanmingense]|uniref:Uncharacterized protein n=2 Tax=Bradyrhizobium yuanmingense TaxID=108015 RepID=A0A0R3CRQ0_9BRAD|nr:hypothetical protein AOQ72_16225 [Bradyrhizobium yuanmingense]
MPPSCKRGEVLRARFGAFEARQQQQRLCTFCRTELKNFAHIPDLTYPFCGRQPSYFGELPMLPILAKLAKLARQLCAYEPCDRAATARSETSALFSVRAWVSLMIKATVDVLPDLS